MHIIPPVCVAAVLLAPVCFASQLAHYTFDTLNNGNFVDTVSAGPAPSSDTDPGTTASNLTAFNLWGNRSVIEIDTSVTPNGKKLSLRDSAFNSGTIDTGKGFAFTITPSGPMSVGLIKFDFANVPSGVTRFGIRYAVGAGAIQTLLADEPLPYTASLSTFNTYELSIDDVLQGVTEPVTFRLHFWGAAGTAYSNRTSIDNIIVEAPEAVVEAARYSFDEITSGTYLSDVTATSTDTHAESVASSFSVFNLWGNRTMIETSGSGRRLSLRDVAFNNTSLDTAKGFQCTITPTSDMSLSKLRFDYANISGGVTKFAIKYSIGGGALADLIVNETLPYTTSLANFGSYEVALGNQLDNVTQPVTFKLYFWGAGTNWSYRTSLDNFVVFAGAPVQQDPPGTWRSALYPAAAWAPNPATATPGFVDANGRFLHDFSYAGYHYGEQAIPNRTGPIFAVAAPTGGDDTGNIQAQIDAAGNTVGGGVVTLQSGIYKVSATLRINKSNVVLRGQGSSQTFILNDRGAATMDSQAVISVATPEPPNQAPWNYVTFWYLGYSRTNVIGDLPAATTRIPVVSTAGFAVGERVNIRPAFNNEYLTDVDMLSKPGWTPATTLPSDYSSGKTITYARKITAIDTVNNVITIDIPTRFPLKAVYAPRVERQMPQVVVEEVGVEGLSIGMKTLNNFNLTTNSRAIGLSRVENCWVKDVKSYKPAGNPTYHVNSHGIVVDKSRLVTIQDCYMGFAENRDTGGNGYLYMINGQDCLFKDSTAEAGRHNTAFNYAYASGNVLLRMTLKNGSLNSDCHQMLSMANLFDGTILDREALEARFRHENVSPSPMHGWAARDITYWNTIGRAQKTSGRAWNVDGAGEMIHTDQLNNRGYVIGTYGENGNGYHKVVTGFFYTWTGGWTGWWDVSQTSPAERDYVEGEGTGNTLLPQSLYEDQLAKRLQ